MSCKMSNFFAKKRNDRFHAESLVVSKDENIHDIYDIVRQIGVGSLSNIYLIRKKEGSCGLPSRRNALFVLKEIDVAKMNADTLAEFENEIACLKSLKGHPNLLRAYETYSYTSEYGRNMIGIVLELCEGGDMLDRARYNEQQVGVILYKLVGAVNYMHKHNFFHRDIKLENILLVSKESDADIRLADFGLTTRFQRNSRFTKRVGTKYTIAPQVLKRDYTYAADMWSVGVVAFTLLSGQKPFRAESGSSVEEAILKGVYNFDCPAWKSISDGAKSFVSKLLEYNPSARYTAEQALQDCWLAQFKPTAAPSTVHDVLSRLKRVTQMSEFEKMAWQVAAHKANPRDVQFAEWNVVFGELDQNHDGKISHNEFTEAMSKSLGCPPKEASVVFRLLDVQKTGFIEYTTFVAALLAVQERVQDNHVLDVFDHLDVDRCGYVTHDHLRKILGRKVSDKYIGKLIKEVDSSQKGRIQYEELKQLLCKPKRSCVPRRSLSLSVRVCGNHHEESPRV